ncbi:MAG: CopG family transcriptional regulator [Nostocales cyanobacterium 94392]|nr:CopG family transcriptional regulator [Nostocales cyanobacterium 94392]
MQFVNFQSKGDRSSYINKVLAEYRRCSLELQMITALQKDAQDCEFQAEIAARDNVVGDGIDAQR